MLQYVDEIIGKEDIVEGFIEIVNMEATEDFQFSHSQSLAFPSRWQTIAKKGLYCSIVFAPTDVSFGLMRMLRSVLGPESDSGPEFIVARTSEELETAIQRKLAERQSK